MGDFKQLEKNDFELVKSIDSTITSYELAKSFFLKNANGDIFVKKAGLHYKFDKRFGDRKHSIIKEPIKGDELLEWKRMHGLKDDDLMFVVKVTLSFSNDEVYQDWGIATAKDCNSNQISKGFYMAETRGLNRILREITQCGFTTAEEMGYGSDDDTNHTKTKVITNDDIRKALEIEFTNIIKSNVIKKEDAIDLLKTAFNVDKTSKLSTEELQNYINIIKDSVGIEEVSNDQKK